MLIFIHDTELNTNIYPVCNSAYILCFWPKNKTITEASQVVRAWSCGCDQGAVGAPGGQWQLGHLRGTVQQNDSAQWGQPRQQCGRKITVLSNPISLLRWRRVLACQTLSPVLVGVWTWVSPRTEQFCLELGFGASVHLHGAIRDVWPKHEPRTFLSCEQDSSNDSEVPQSQMLVKDLKSWPSTLEPWSSFFMARKEHWLQCPVESRDEESWARFKVAFPGEGSEWSYNKDEQVYKDRKSLNRNQYKEKNRPSRYICSFCLWVDPSENAGIGKNSQYGPKSYTDFYC